MSVNSDCPVYQHTKWFANGNGDITPNSLQLGQDALKTDNYFFNWFRGTAVLNMIDSTPEPKRTLEGLCPFYGNVARSGIWDEKGNFVEEEFQKLVGRAFSLSKINENGEEGLYITRKIFNEFLESQRENREGADPKSEATKVVRIPITNADVTDGSVGSLFTMLTGESHVVYNGEKAVQVAQVREFYQHPLTVQERVAEKHRRASGWWCTIL